MKRQILFVDDEERILDGLRRMLRPMRAEWDMSFATSGAEALETLAGVDVDLMVSDMRMPGMDGAELLTRATTLSPRTLRIALSGHSDADVNLRCTGIAHQYLTKPCDAAALMETITHACDLRAAFPNLELQQLVTSVGVLPSEQGAYARLTNELTRSTQNLHEIAAIVATDMGMSAKVLQIVNSGFLGAGQFQASAAAAAKTLGTETLSALMHVGLIQEATFQDDWLWQRAMASQRCVRAIAQAQQWDDSKVDEATTAAGLLHVGALVLRAHVAQGGDLLRVLDTARFDDAPVDPAASRDLEAGVGAALLGFWGLPRAIVDVVRNHRCDSPLAEGELTIESLGQIAEALATEDYAAERGLPQASGARPADEQSRLDEWRRASHANAAGVAA